MSFSKLRRFDVQAKYSLILSCVSVIPFVAAAALLWRNFNPEVRQILYGAKGNFVPAFVGAVFLSLLPGILGFFLGWSSVGKRRNDKPAYSWLGFFLGGTLVTFDVVLLIAFLMLRIKSPA